MIGRFLTVVLLLCAAIVSMSYAAEPNAAGPIRFRRVLVPADRPETWPRGEQRYLPIEASEFERLAGPQQNAETPLVPAATRIQAAEYTARWTEAGVLNGSGQLEVTHAGPASFLPLRPLQFALHNARWEDADNAVISSAPEGEHLLSVSAPGRLLFDWSLRGVQETGGAVAFRLGLPASPATALTVDLPNDLRPSIDEGIVVEQTSPDASTRRWQIQIRGSNRPTLRIAKANLAPEHQQLNLVRQETSYEFSSRGVEVSSLLKIDVLGEPVRQIAIEVDAGLTLAVAKYGETNIPWFAGKSESDQASRVVLTLPEPLLGRGRVIRLGAVAAIPFGVEWQLPGLRVDGMFWQEGSARLILPAPLSLTELKTVGCRQTETRPLLAPLSGEEVIFQLYSPAAQIVAAIGDQESRIRLASGTSIELDAKTTTARTEAHLSAGQGEQFVLTASVARRWTVDSVEILPADALLTWDFQPGEGDRGSLTVRLSKALNSRRSIELVVTSHRRGTLPGEMLRGADLEILKFDGVSDAQRLVAIEYRGPHRLRTSDRLQSLRIPTAQMLAEQLELFATPPSEAVVPLELGVENLSVSVVRQSPIYAGAVRVEVTAHRSTLTERYEIDCTPENSQLERVLVTFSQPRTAPLAWQNRPDGSQLVARRLEAGEGPTSGESWEVQLPASAPGERVQIAAVRTIPWIERQAISLAWLPTASRQEALLHVLADSDYMPAIESRLQPMAVDPPAAGRYSPLVAAYRYDSSRDSLTQADAVITIAPGGAERERSLWAWSVQHDAMLLPQGELAHTVVYRLENHGRSKVALGLPDSARLQAMWINNERAPLRGAYLAEDGAHTLALPEGHRFPTVTICYRTPVAVNALVADLHVPVAELDCPQLTHARTLWLPSQYRLLGVAEGRDVHQSASTWSHRIFGPLARAPGQPTSDPLALLSSGVHEAFRMRLEPPAEAATTLRRIGKVRRDSAMTWGLMLSGSGGTRALNNPSALRVDPRALDELGIFPTTLVELPDEPAVEDRGRALLEQAGLVLLARDGSLLLTSRRQAALWHSQLSATTNPAVFCVLEGPLSAQFESSTDSTMAEVGGWASAAIAARPLWTVPELAGESFATRTDWTAFPFESGVSQPFVVRVLAVEAVYAWSWSVLLLGCVLAWWMAARGLRFALWALLTTVLAALMAPEHLVPVTSAAVLGQAIGIVLRVLWNASRSGITPGPSSERAKSFWKLAPAGAVGLLLIGFLSALALGQETPPASEAPVYQVLIPVDGEQQTVGDNYYLPEPLYRDLYREQASAETAARKWLLEDAQYVATLSSGAMGELAISDITARFTLNVLQRATRVELPLGGKQASVFPGSVRLDGRAVQFEQSAAGDLLSIEVATAGRRQLEVTLHPVAQIDGSSRICELVTPQVATARVTLDAPPEAALTVPSARGGMQVDVGTGRRLVDLGPTSRLTLKWPASPMATVSQPEFEVEELYWLKVKPGSVVIDARFKVRVLEGRLQQLRVAADSRLRLLPSPDASVVGAVRTEPGEPVTFELKQAATDEVTVSASFLVSGATGAGNLLFPQLAVAGPRSSRRFLAVTVDPILEETFGGTAAKAPLAEFLQRWGPAEGKPMEAFELPVGESDWSLAARPREPTIEVREKLALVFRPDRLMVGMLADLEASAGFRFQHRVRIPADFTVSSISVREGDVEVPVRWSRGPQGMLTVFLSTPVSGPQKLLLHGWLPLEPTAVVGIPDLRLEGAQVTSLDVLAFRHPERVVALGEIAGHSVDSNQDEGRTLNEALFERLIDSATAQRGRLVAALHSADPGLKAEFQVSVNQPVARATQAIAVRRVDANWETQIDLVVEVREGFVDTLHLVLPAECVGPFNVSGPASVAVLEFPSQQQRVLTIRPSEAIDRKYEVRVSSPLKPAAGERVRVPNVRLLQFPDARSFIAVPTQQGSRRVAWDLQGLRPAELPPSLANAVEADPTSSWYEAVSTSFSGQLETIEPYDRQARLALADLTVDYGSSGRGSFVVAAFDLEAASRAECELQLPPGSRLLAAMLNGSPALVRATQDARWQVSLGESQYPQRLEVIYQSDANEEGSLQAPEIVGLKPAKTLWSVAADSHSVRPSNEPVAVGAVRHELERLRSAIELVSRAAEASSEQADSERQRWFEPWGRLLLSVRSRLERLRSLVGEANVPDDLAERLTELDRRQSADIARLGLADYMTQLSASTSRAENPVDLWRWTSPRASSASHFLSESEPGSLELSRDGSPIRAGSVLPILIAVAALFLAAFTATRQYLYEAMERWPFAVGVLVGLVWWLWLKPPIVGWGIILVSLAGAALASRVLHRDRSLFHTGDEL